MTTEFAVSILINSNDSDDEYVLFEDIKKVLEAYDNILDWKTTTIVTDKESYA